MAGAAGKELLAAFTANGWVKAGNRPRSLHITEAGRQHINRRFGLTG